MIFGHGRMSINTIDIQHPNELLPLACFLPLGRDGPKAGMVPFTGQLYKFLMGRFYIFFLDLAFPPH